MLSRTIETILKKHKNLSIEKVLAYTEKSTFGFLLVILSLPSALPVPAPGYSIPFGILLIIISLQIICKRKSPWFPPSWKSKKIPVEKLAGSLGKIKKFIEFFEHLIRTRIRWVYTKGYRFFGLLVFLCACCMLIPIPGTNTIPALGVFIIGLGMIEEDGLAGIMGFFVAIVGITIAIAIIFLGVEALDFIKQWIVDQSVKIK